MSFHCWPSKSGTGTLVNSTAIKNTYCSTWGTSTVATVAAAIAPATVAATAIATAAVAGTAIAWASGALEKQWRHETEVAIPSQG